MVTRTRKPRPRSRFKMPPQSDSTVKAVLSLERFLPDFKHGSGVGDYVDGGKDCP